MSEVSHLSEFQNYVGTRFRVVGGPQLEIELIGADPLPGGGGPPGVRNDPFSLVFRGPFEPGLPQSIHTLEHDSLGTLQLFLVPIGPEGDRLGTHYQALFN